MHDAILTIAPTGTLEVIYHGNAEPNTGDIGATVANRRGAYVLPSNVVLRCVFKALRWLFGSRGQVSEWTRRWMCLFSLWRTDGTRLPGTYHGHDAAVEVEVSMLEKGEL